MSTLTICASINFLEVYGGIIGGEEKDKEGELEKK